MDFKYYSSLDEYRTRKVPQIKNINVKYQDFYISLFLLNPLGFGIPSTLLRDYSGVLLDTWFYNNKSPFRIRRNLIMSTGLGIETTFKANFSFLIGMMMAGVYLRSDCNVYSFYHVLKLPQNYQLSFNRTKKHPDLFAFDKANNFYIVDAKGSLTPKKGGIVKNSRMSKGKIQTQAVTNVQFMTGNRFIRHSLSYLVIGTGVNQVTNLLETHVVDPVLENEGSTVYILPNVLKLLSHEKVLSLLDGSDAEEIDEDSLSFKKIKVSNRFELKIGLKQFQIEMRYLNILRKIDAEYKENKLSSDLSVKTFNEIENHLKAHFLDHNEKYSQIISEMAVDIVKNIDQNTGKYNDTIYELYELLIDQYISDRLNHRFDDHFKFVLNHFLYEQSYVEMEKCLTYELKDNIHDLTIDVIDNS
ncbi:hypothetical protein [Convivina intestini]|uniref:hypothetical protein n=1 Tax=Convivina intestini TaxID=1505726 RepID=UPI00200EE03F|nr:hypothetical protein [Convivina intestini]CAH1856999.1 hypothetical protein R078131_01515 [Convivina intestini]